MNKELAAFRVCGLAAAAGSLLWAGGVSAHHSIAKFDQSKNWTFRGTVLEWVWANPHCWVYVNVTKGDGSVEKWGFESGGPNMLIRRGWNKNDINVGDKITIDAHPARDGQHVGVVQNLFTAKGKVVTERQGGDLEAEPDASNTPTKPTGVDYK